MNRRMTSTEKTSENTVNQSKGGITSFKLMSSVGLGLGSEDGCEN
jgi:hypothetical protein